MNVASPELCKERYELSGWRTIIKPSPDMESHKYPQYDQGYLLRKLPPIWTMEAFTDNSYRIWMDEHHHGFGNTPENAACSHAMELFKQGY